MEQFKMPLREIESTFTLSEMAMMSWSSREQASKMSPKTKSKRLRKKTISEKVREGIKRSYIDGEELENFKDGREEFVMDSPDLPTNVPRRFINEDGEFDMRLMKGKEVIKYMSNKGFPEE